MTMTPVPEQATLGTFEQDDLGTDDDDPLPALEIESSLKSARHSIVLRHVDVGAPTGEAVPFEPWTVGGWWRAFWVALESRHDTGLGYPVGFRKCDKEDWDDS